MKRFDSCTTSDLKTVVFVSVSRGCWCYPLYTQLHISFNWIFITFFKVNPHFWIIFPVSRDWRAQNVNTQFCNVKRTLDTFSVNHFQPSESTRNYSVIWSFVVWSSSVILLSIFQEIPAWKTNEGWMNNVVGAYNGFHAGSFEPL